MFFNTINMIITLFSWMNNCPHCDPYDLWIVNRFHWCFRPYIIFCKHDFRWCYLMFSLENIICGHESWCKISRVLFGIDIFLFVGHEPSWITANLFVTNLWNLGEVFRMYWVSCMPYVPNTVSCIGIFKSNFNILSALTATEAALNSSRRKVVCFNGVTHDLPITNEHEMHHHNSNVLIMIQFQITFIDICKMM